MSDERDSEWHKPDERIPSSRGRRPLKRSDPHSPPLSARAVAAALTAFALSGGVFANPSAARLLPRTPTDDLPLACPSASLLTATLHQRLDRPTAHVARIGSITSAGFGPAPAGAPRKTTSQYERTCTYARGSVTPVTVSFVSPVTLAQFAAAREALNKSIGVIVLRDLGSPAWATRTGGLVFVLRGSVDVVISASKTSLAGLTALARAIRE